MGERHKSPLRTECRLYVFAALNLGTLRTVLSGEPKPEGPMLIESTEQFQAAAGVAIQRGPNEVTESDFESLPLATRTKLLILQEHGVVRLRPSDAQKPDPRSEPDK